MFKGEEVNANIWITVYCFNALQLNKRNPRSRELCCLIEFLKKDTKTMKFLGIYDDRLTEE